MLKSVRLRLLIMALLPLIVLMPLLMVVAMAIARFVVELNALMVTAMFTGMRISELRGLTWDYVDLDMKLIVVCERADRFNDLGKTKSRTSRRSIPGAGCGSASL